MNKPANIFDCSFTVRELDYSHNNLWVKLFFPKELNFNPDFYKLKNIFSNVLITKNYDGLEIEGNVENSELRKYIVEKYVAYPWNCC